MTKHSIAKIHVVGLGLTLALGACDKGESKDAKATADAKAKTGDAKTGDAKTGDAKAGDAKADQGADEPLDERVVKAARLANEIEAEPARADEILAEAGMDRAAFNALIYEVSTPELAEQYRLARAREEG
ncbi:hypothetical protein [Paraliomyxa miuraensis]|uniref:hypothetical protein n=1 Tax=Paraliomyxa miuraensis TaxID=376150 RepID=UPI0022599AA4|nr:hypothetical protein [Paraliomyxa miuraensis]MCX4239260.1 hypothetical protein [Paraliomyxa miuraensis]